MIQSLNEISALDKNFISTGIPSLDSVMGGGLSVSGVHMIAGQSGVGKSRLAIKISKNINYSEKVLIITLETSKQGWASWCNNQIYNPDNYLISEENDYKKICDLILENRPKCVIIDSVNHLDVTISEVEDCVMSLQKVCQLIKCPILLIGQLDMKKGKVEQVRGSQSWCFVPDSVFLMKHYIFDEKKYIKELKNEYEKKRINGNFRKDDGWKSHVLSRIEESLEKEKELNKNKIIFFCSKNRYGPTDKIAYFKHNEIGLEEC